jgi:Leucine-rich repeat (LRR) protein
MRGVMAMVILGGSCALAIRNLSQPVTAQNMANYEMLLSYSNAKDIQGPLWTRIRQTTYIRSMLFSDLPAEIGDFDNLETLDLSDSQLAALSPQIGQLSKLEWLNVGNTLLAYLPPEIGQLVKLQSLDLSNSEVVTLPPEINQLTRLRRLDLSNSKIIELPSGLEDNPNLIILLDWTPLAESRGQ